jgi:membrane protease YdiL (CAAX protease family)
LNGWSDRPIFQHHDSKGPRWHGQVLAIGGAWLLTSALFVVAHIGSYPLVAPHPIGIAGLVGDLVRWRTGSTTASTITHCLLNLWQEVGAILLVALGWP